MMKRSIYIKTSKPLLPAQKPITLISNFAGCGHTKSLVAGFRTVQGLGPVAASPDIGINFHPDAAPMEPIATFFAVAIKMLLLRSMPWPWKCPNSAAGSREREMLVQQARVQTPPNRRVDLEEQEWSR
jgi:hypothetical protein